MSSKVSAVGIVLVVVCIAVSVFAVVRQQFLSRRLAGVEHAVKQLEGCVADLSTTARQTLMHMHTQEIGWQAETGKQAAALRNIEESAKERFMDMRKLIDHMRFDINKLRAAKPAPK